MLVSPIKCGVAAVKKYAEINRPLDGNSRIYKQYFHIGFAADTIGPMVPVIKDADKRAFSNQHRNERTGKYRRVTAG